ncbi:hypothetical protein E2P81_ATG05680 [Venturia nashicola]|uniref:Lysophospholipase n=1 Tax=Venturia nashicola TaxID=86259 RepID=A0A4Z1NYI6_9PEZI|nr:hypothetical protein E6O75_ATG05819 [Venturia nashicola]TLD29386.1 hypothetical protein E2P81_ATG05680 [Venturia nashicola]
MRLESIHGVLVVLVSVILSLTTSTLATPTHNRNASQPYAPFLSDCPTDKPLTRPADSISEDEALYTIKRKAKASIALEAWLKKTDPRLPTSNLPSIGLTTSGGGYRSLLTGAGIIRAFDAREDKQLPTSGLLQSLTHSCSLSGGAWLTSSIGGNGFPTISSLQNALWRKSFQAPLYIPYENGSTFRSSFLSAYDKILDDINSKTKAGFQATITDLWGRLLSYQLLQGPDGGVATRLSNAPDEDYWKNHEAPYPIITALGVNEGLCKPRTRAFQYEFHPYEFGSWDPGVAAFARTKYLGTSMMNGKPAIPGICIQNFDNLGHVFGTSSNLFDEACVNSKKNQVSMKSQISTMEKLFPSLAPLFHDAKEQRKESLYSKYPNPWKGSAASPAVQKDTDILLVDGGLSMQNNPVWPLLHPHRPLDVIIVNDNSADTPTNYPNGSELRRTYEQAKESGLTRMPYIPTADVFVAKGMDKRASFFGCEEKEKITLVYLPNTPFWYNSGTPTMKLEYTHKQVDGMIENGMYIATQGNDAEWPFCLGCAITLKTGAATPSACRPCLQRYCYKEKG